MAQRSWASARHFLVPEEIPDAPEERQALQADMAFLLPWKAEALAVASWKETAGLAEIFLARLALLLV